MSLSFYSPILRPRQIKEKIIKTNIDWKEGMIIRSSNWLGDCLMSLPAIYKFRQLLPEKCQLIILCRKSVAGFWQSIPWISKVVVLSGKHAGSVDRRKIRSLNAGVGVVIPNSFSSALDLWHCGLPIRIGRAGRGRKFILTHTIPAWPKEKSKQGASYHQVANYLDLPAALGWLGWDTNYEPIHLPDAIEQCHALHLPVGEKPCLVLSPGAAYGPAKQWPIEHFAEISRRWITEKKGDVIITGTPKDCAIGEQIAQQINMPEQTHNLVGKTSLNQLMAILDCATLLLVNDSGAMHLAAALGKTGVAIFGSTDQIATGPLGGKWILLNHHLSCAPCFKRECPKETQRYQCLIDIQPNEAWEALCSLAL